MCHQLRCVVASLFEGVNCKEIFTLRFDQSVKVPAPSELVNRAISVSFMRGFDAKFCTDVVFDLRICAYVLLGG